MLYKVIHSGLNSVVKRSTNTCNLFCNIAENELKTVVACFTTRVQTCLATNQVLDGCKHLLQKVEWFYSLKKHLYMLRDLTAQRLVPTVHGIFFFCNRSLGVATNQITTSNEHLTSFSLPIKNIIFSK